MYSDREVLEDPLDFVHSSLSQGNKVIYYQKECYRRTLSCPASASSSVTNLDSCGKLESSAASVPMSSSSRSQSSNSVDSGTKQSRALVSDDWEQEENEVFEDVTKPSPGAKMFVAALSDIVQHDEAAGKFQPQEAETIKPPGLKTQWLNTGAPEIRQKLQDTATNMSGNETDGTDVDLPGNKTEWLDTEASKPPRNKTQWQGAVKLESNENKARWSDPGTSKLVSKGQWQDDAKHRNETWRASNPVEPGRKAMWKDAADSGKAKDKNELGTTTTAKSKKQFNKQETKSNNGSLSNEPILMKLPKGKLVMTKLSVVEKLSLHYFEEGHVKVLSNVREPDDQHCYLFIPDVKNYPEVLENLIENCWPTAADPQPTERSAGEVQKRRVTYSRNHLMAIKLFVNDVPDLPEPLMKKNK